VDGLIRVNTGLAGFFACAAIHYFIYWWLSRHERVFLVFSVQCAAYAAFCVGISAYFAASTVPETQAALNRFATFGVLSHAVVLQFYAVLAARRDRAFRALVTTTLLCLAVLNQWAPLRGTVTALQPVRMLGGATAFVPIRTPPGFSLVLAYLATVAVQVYGFVAAREISKRDRVGAGLIAFGSAAVLAGAVVGVLVDFAHLRAPYVGALPHAIFVVCVALFLARSYARRGARLSASESRLDRSLRETQEALASLQAEQQLREEADRARRKALEAFVQAQKAELASQLAAGVAHDFNNVLSVIGTWSAVLLDDPGASSNRDAARQALGNAQRQGQSLTRQLMALARPEARSVSRFPLARAIQATVQTLRAALPQGSELKVGVADAPDVEADEGEIQQVIYNLVLNAGDAMGGGGLIQVQSGVETLRAPLAVVGGHLPAGCWATLTVSDSGPGIAPAVRDRIFELFFSTKAPGRGSGLGLATVLRIAKISGGGITVHSEPGHGATFTLYLPCAGVSPSAKMVPQAQRSGELSRTSAPRS